MVGDYFFFMNNISVNTSTYGDVYEPVNIDSAG